MSDPNGWCGNVLSSILYGILLFGTLKKYIFNRGRNEKFLFTYKATLFKLIIYCNKKIVIFNQKILFNDSMEVLVDHRAFEAAFKFDFLLRLIIALRLHSHTQKLFCYFYCFYSNLSFLIKFYVTKLNSLHIIFATNILV